MIHSSQGSHSYLLNLSRSLDRGILAHLHGSKSLEPLVSAKGAAEENWGEVKRGEGLETSEVKRVFVPRLTGAC
ncbi:hypothetical protein E2C01_075174 [Portunus trituberculatus]|uniref:Uncharacterized protein n=1 Tax=Portunus trituberculatus TaxID=210409 RepID=A0A5B7I5G0_PORTR|nr:hypothetical protein [Portunus trituberculatus]